MDFEFDVRMLSKGNLCLQQCTARVSFNLLGLTQCLAFQMSPRMLLSRSTYSALTPSMKGRWLAHISLSITILHTNLQSICLIFSGHILQAMTVVILQIVRYFSFFNSLDRQGNTFQLPIIENGTGRHR